MSVNIDSTDIGRFGRIIEVKSLMPNVLQRGKSSGFETQSSRVPEWHAGALFMQNGW